MGLKQFLSCVVFMWLAAAPLARAADAEADSKRLYKEGTKHYNLGEFEEAVTAYKSGYDAKPDPVFLFNIAQAYRLWNKPDKAIFFYKSFLRNLPEAPNRPEVERRIAEMQTELDKQTAQKQEPDLASTTPVITAPTNPPPLPMAMTPPEASDGTTLKKTAAPASDAPIYKQWWFWTALGAVALGTVAVIAVSSGGSSAPPKADFPVTKVF